MYLSSRCSEQVLEPQSDKKSKATDKRAEMDVVARWGWEEGMEGRRWERKMAINTQRHNKKGAVFTHSLTQKFTQLSTCSGNQWGRMEHLLLRAHGKQLKAQNMCNRRAGEGERSVEASLASHATPMKATYVANGCALASHWCVAPGRQGWGSYY